MYQPQTGRAPPRQSRQIPRQFPYPLRNVRVPYKSGYQQAAGGDVRAQRQGPVTSAAQGKNSPNSSSINPQMLSASSITSSRKVSETQEDDSELRTYISDGFGAVQHALFDLTEQIGHLSARMEDYLKILESAGASVVPEGLETDDLDLGDMANLVNY
ncbi:hypothetical protein CDEST_02083 [Colletotrichum destructivum]|uniref:Uncharacterized protein n=1 Tax=Colletotrichum destructivum TaxID=34406 RepID=A0AAX4I1J8_9PEZI|nr:hypothetical protein CDEST_02083 [Colletotrichum destructivum]